MNLKQTRILTQEFSSTQASSPQTFAKCPVQLALPHLNQDHTKHDINKQADTQIVVRKWRLIIICLFY